MTLHGWDCWLRAVLGIQPAQREIPTVIDGGRTVL
jgi:hypothetical protein